MFERVLIANRGEIAVRIERTLARMGIESVAVFSDADAGAPHVRRADRALHIGPTPARESYLSIERVLDAAARSGAEAIHPGYGFLSERPDFAAACAEAGVAFVGPGPEAMALLGDKGRARAVAETAGVPTLPGWSGEDLTDEEIAERVEPGDLPLLVKAAAGGGGKGMRLVRRREELAEALAAARREAAAAFGDERLIVERFVERSRHLEVQVFADAHGNAIHLGERECSLQRRHQKVVEEAPSPVVKEELRQRMGEAAVALARHAGYINAGTVELIAERDDPSRFWFLEVNTRLQVEHPVTEEVTGLDLVELQLRVAAGEALPLTQTEVTRRGCAIEARIYAEDPAAGFLPATGEVVAYREPTGTGAATGTRPGTVRVDSVMRPGTVRVDRDIRPGTVRVDSGTRPGAVRIDSGIEQGSVVGTDYDPMLAKVIATGADRHEALRRLRAALGELVIAGPTTNIAYLRVLLDRPEVRAGEIDTGLIERLGDEVAVLEPSPELAAIAAVALLGEPEDDDPWSEREGWRMQGPAWITQMLDVDGRFLEIAIRSAGPPSIANAIAIRSAIEGGPSRFAWEWRRGEASGTLSAVDGPKTPDIEGFSAHQHSVFRDGAAVWVHGPDVGAVRFSAAAPESAAAGAGEGTLEAPMPGTVAQLRVEPGAEVTAGETLVVLESMKMEIAIASPRDGTVAAVLVVVGDKVDRGATLIELAAEGPSASGPARRAQMQTVREAEGA